MAAETAAEMDEATPDSDSPPVAVTDEATSDSDSALAVDTIEAAPTRQTTSHTVINFRLGVTTPSLWLSQKALSESLDGHHPRRRPRKLGQPRDRGPQEGIAPGRTSNRGKCI
jgi:hypothetical protein